MVGALVMAPKSVTLRRHDHLVSVLFGDLLSHSYNITFLMFLDLVMDKYSTFQPSSRITLWCDVKVSEPLGEPAQLR